MNQLASAVSEFYDDLGTEFSNDVLSLTFSEFGRRVAENNGGTDHGTAAPVMLFEMLCKAVLLWENCPI